MLSTWRRRRSGRNESPAATSTSAQHSEPPRNPVNPELRVWQLQLDEFAAQRAEHDRQFFELLSELDSGHRVRQEQVSGLMRNVRLAFDAAQAQRHNDSRTAQNDLREYAIRMQESCVTQCEGSRDAAAREGLVRCEERATRLRILYEATRVQLDEWTAKMGLSGAVWTTLIKRLRSVLDGQPDITLAPSTEPNPSVHQNALWLNAGLGSSRLPDASLPGFPRQVDVLAQLDAPSPQPPATATDIEALDSVIVAHPEETTAYRDAFSQLQSIRSRMWRHMSATHSDGLKTWDAAFRNLEAELSAVFMYRPCMNGEGDDTVVLAATMLMAFRAAESRRKMELQRSWRYHIRELMDLVERWYLNDPGIQEYAEKQARAAEARIQRRLAIEPGLKSEADLIFEQLYWAGCSFQYGSSSSSGFQPQSLARVPDIASPLPVVPSGQPQLETYRRQQQMHAEDFLHTQLAYRSDGRRSETKLCSSFATALRGWETRAAQAELLRSSEFAHTLERVRKLHEDSVARNCHEVAMSLERQFVESQGLRERTFLCELERLQEQLLHVCHKFRDKVSAARELEAESITRAPIVQMSAD